MCNTRRPDLLSLPLSPLPSHVCLAWRCCRTVEIKTIQMYYDVFPSEGLGGEPGVWEKLGAETFQNYCQMGGFGPTSSNEKKKKKSNAKQAAQSPTRSSAVWSRAVQRRTEEPQEPRSSHTSSPTEAGSTSSEEGTAKPRAAVVLESRARVD